MTTRGALGGIGALVSIGATAMGCGHWSGNCNEMAFDREPVVYVGFDRVVDRDDYTIEGTTDTGAFSCSLADDAAEDVRCKNVGFLHSGSAGAVTESNLRIPPGGRGGLAITARTRSLTFTLRAGDREIAGGSWTSLRFESYEPNGEGCPPTVERVNLHTTVRP